MANYLSQVARPENKLERIAEQLEESRHDLVEGGLGNWYQPDGEEEVAKKARIAQEIVAAVKKRNGMHGELLARLVPTRRSLHALYMQQVTLPEVQEEADIFDIGLGDGLDDGISGIKTHSHEVAFARQSVQHWINHLRGLPETPAMLNYIGLPRATAEELVDELITGLLRLRAEDALVSVMQN
ncbi:type III secretion system effector, partial [Escherichia coli]|nr:type III secretion system effector [Escherichia coli]